MLDATRLQIFRQLSASPERAFQVVYDVERFPDFMPNISAATVLESTPERRVVAWEMEIDGAPLEWTEEITYSHAALRTSFRALTGVFDRFDGHWQVSAEGAGSRVDLLIEYDLGVPEIQEIIGPILKVRLTENLEAMLENIETRVRGA